MASYEAVGAVGLTLQALLADRVEHPSGNGDVVPVTLGPPGPERDPEGAAESPRINLFLFRVSENAFLKNQDLPGQGSRGAYGHPPLTLDLHYLLTVYGSSANGAFFDETPAHRVLGSAMRALHDHAEITDSVTTRRSPAGVPVLDPALRGEHERIKLTLQPLGLEDLTNVWTSLELSYRLSVAYEVSVVQIESRRPRRYPRPVQEPPGAGPRVHAAPLRRPRILSVAVRRVGDQPNLERSMPFARVGDTLVIRGTHFGGGMLTVHLGDIDAGPVTVSTAGDRIEVLVPDDQLPDGTPIPPAARLQPGPHAVEVAARAAALPGVALGSGRAVFVLVPRVADAAVSGRTLTVTGTRLLATDMTGQVVAGDAVIDRGEYLPTSTDTALDLTLPTSLPAFPVAARVSGSLTPFPDLPPQFDIGVTIGGTGPVTATLDGTPTSIEGAAGLLQAAIRAVHASPAFNRALVAATADGLVVIPGDLSSPVAFETGPLADPLRLAGDSAARHVYLSGVLRPFPELSAASPALELEMAGATATVALGDAPASIAGAATALESAIRSADPSPAFAGARVTDVGDRLCLLPGAAAPVEVRPTAGDPTTAAELQLAGLYLLRVRVGGVESVDEVHVGLP